MQMREALPLLLHPAGVARPAFSPYWARRAPYPCCLPSSSASSLPCCQQPSLPCSSTPVGWERCPRCFLPRSPATLLLRPTTGLTTGLPCSSTPTVKTQLRCYSSIFLRHPSSPADVTLLFEEKPACGRIRQDPVEGDEERWRWAEEKEEKGRGGGQEEERRGMGCGDRGREGIGS